MKSWSAFVLSALCASAALAEPPPSPALSAPGQKAASALIEKALVAPLKKAETRRSRFSREGPVAAERRIRVLDAEALTDARGKHFVRFAIDVRRPYDQDQAWEQDAVIGCAYPEDKRVFVRSGDEYLPASSLLGKDVEPEPSACRVSPVGAAVQAAAGA